MAEDFSDPDDRQILCVDNGVAAGGAHAVTADAEELKRSLRRDSRPFDKLRAGSRLSSGAKLRCLSRGSPLKSLNKLRAVHFPRSFAG